MDSLSADSVPGRAGWHVQITASQLPVLHPGAKHGYALGMRHWLMKSEPEVYSVDHLQKDGKTLWTDIRNFQVRNHMQQDMRVGDLALFYHSNADPPGVAGLMRVTGEALPDPTQYDRRNEHFEKRATKEKPVWFCVEVSYVAKAKTFVGLPDLRAHPGLTTMALLKKGSRLSITPVSEGEFDVVLALAGMKRPK